MLVQFTLLLTLGDMFVHIYIFYFRNIGSLVMI